MRDVNGRETRPTADDGVTIACRTTFCFLRVYASVFMLREVEGLGGVGANGMAVSVPL